MDELQNKAYYLYYSQTGASEQRFWYHTKPNLNILVNNAVSDVQEPRIESEILNLLQEKASKVLKFKTIVNPNGDIPELKTPSLIILHPSLYHNGNKKLIKSIKEIALKKGNSDRIYRNTILFLSLSMIVWRHRLQLNMHLSYLLVFCFQLIVLFFKVFILESKKQKYT